MSGEETPGSKQLARELGAFIQSQMEKCFDSIELLRREVSQLSSAFSEWRGEAKWRGKAEENLEERVAALEKFKEKAIIFQTKTVAYCSAAAIFLGPASSWIWNKMTAGPPVGGH